MKTLSGGLDRSAWFALAAVVLAFLSAACSQWHALVSPYVINDDACQHIWWMHVFRDPSLFAGDVLFKHAQGIEPFGVSAFYQATAFLVDPVTVSRYLPLVLLPLTCFFIFRIVRRLSGDDRTALFASAAFAVTKLYLQHMTGGFGHSFGYPLLAAYLWFFMEERWAVCALVLGIAVLFFPVIFAVGALAWTIALLLRAVGPCEERKGAGRSARWLVLAIASGIAILATRYVVFADPAAGQILTRDAVMRMPELTEAGRWTVWPVENIFSALARFAEDGFFLFRMLWKSMLPSVAKQFLIGSHALLIVLIGCSALWWRRRVGEAVRYFVPLLMSSVAFYFLSSAFLLKLYASDRYLSYVISLLAFLFVIVPVGASVASFSSVRLGRFMWPALASILLLNVPLVRNVGLVDYSAHRRLYEYLGTLPKDALIAARPDLADGIPIFAKRSVYLNFEMSVPLYDRYWVEMSSRTRNFFRAYYAEDLRDVVGILSRAGVTEIVVDRSDFDSRKLADGVYFEPFRSEIRQETAGHSFFALAHLPDASCAFRDGTICVVGRNALEELAGKGGRGQ